MDGQDYNLEGLLKALCETDGTSGREDKVRDYIISQLGGADYTVDALGNLTVRVKGRKRARNVVMLCAHMDEVGVMATYIRSDGLIKFVTVGGIVPTALAGKAVRFENGTVGVIGLKPVHVCSADEKLAQPDKKDLCIDIGAADKAEAAALVSPGDAAVFVSRYTEMGSKVLSKAIDDRVGCAVMLDMIRRGVEYDAVFCFNVQEEVGLRGAKASAFAAAPDYAIVLEGTTAADVADAKEEARVCVQGKGACVSMMDNATVYSPALFRSALRIAEENGIPAQLKTAVAGGNEAGSVHVSRTGVKTVTVNVPVRYIHSPSSVCDLRDVAAVRALAEKLTEAFADANGSEI